MRLPGSDQSLIGQMQYAESNCDPSTRSEKCNEQPLVVEEMSVHAADTSAGRYLVCGCYNTDR